MVGGARRFLVWIAALALISACDERPDDAELDRMLEEVRAAEREARETRAVEDESASWTLTVAGETGRGRPEIFSYARLGEISPAEFTARPELVGAVPASFSGPRISDVLAAVGGAREGVTELTLTASDGFRATIAMDDVMAFPIVLAMQRDGERLTREAGGPLLAAFPLADHPELSERYTESWWVYYVTHVIVGTERPSVRVGTELLDGAALSALPGRTISAHVGYRVGWPTEAALIHGPTLASIVEAVGTDLAGVGSVRVLAHAPITRGERPTRVGGDDVRAGDVILGLAYGDPPEPIPARLGGPIVLAFTDELAARLEGYDWLTFVDELVVERDEDVAETAPAPAPDEGEGAP